MALPLPAPAHGLDRAAPLLWATGALAFVHDERATLWDIAGAAPVVIEAGGLLTSEQGRPIFPLDPDGYHGEPIPLLAGDPLAHDQALRDILSLG
jgi:fructose-1,6-bisphosphatase/inositol monophosphatase family enzyme